MPQLLQDRKHKKLIDMLNENRIIDYLENQSFQAGFELIIDNEGFTFF